jgi:hypothetical protein
MHLDVAAWRSRAYQLVQTGGHRYASLRRHRGFSTADSRCFPTPAFVAASWVQAPRIGGQPVDRHASGRAARRAAGFITFGLLDGIGPGAARVHQPRRRRHRQRRVARQPLRWGRFHRPRRIFPAFVTAAGLPDTGVVGTARGVVVRDWRRALSLRGCNGSTTSRRGPGGGGRDGLARTTSGLFEFARIWIAGRSLMRLLTRWDRPGRFRTSPCGRPAGVQLADRLLRGRSRRDLDPHFVTGIAHCDGYRPLSTAVGANGTSPPATQLHRAAMPGGCGASHPPAVSHRQLNAGLPADVVATPAQLAGRRRRSSSKRARAHVSTGSRFDRLAPVVTPAGMAGATAPTMGWRWEPC